MIPVSTCAELEFLIYRKRWVSFLHVLFECPLKMCCFSENLDNVLNMLVRPRGNTVYDSH